MYSDKYKEHPQKIKATRQEYTIDDDNNNSTSSNPYH